MNAMRLCIKWRIQQNFYLDRKSHFFHLNFYNAYLNALGA